MTDVSKAFFKAPITRTVCVELPQEEGAEEDEVGLLLMSVDATRRSRKFPEEVYGALLCCIEIIWSRVVTKKDSPGLCDVMRFYLVCFGV